jgi:hypothetical protein
MNNINRMEKTAWEDFWVLIGMCALLVLFIICFVPYSHAEDKWSFKAGIAHPAYQSNAEYGKGPVFKLRAEYEVTPRLTIEAEKRSYIFEGEPFGNDQDWESSYLDIGVMYEF